METSASHLAILSRLVLEENDIGDVGAKALAAALPRARSLENVFLRGNSVGKAHAVSKSNHTQARNSRGLVATYSSRLSVHVQTLACLAS